MLAARVAATLSALGPFSPRPHLAVALSGGADSMALTLLAHAWAQANNGRITALTIDHALRAESRHEAEQVAAWMKERGIDHHILTPHHTSDSNNLQESARIWRYAALASFCRKEGILHCLVAHNAGDNRETVAHNIARGETADGASGMGSARNVNGVRFLRPLLVTERADLEDFLRAEHAPWVNDPSNQNTQFARVRVRQALQADAGRVEELDRMIRTQSAARTARDHALAVAAVQCVTISPLGFAEIDVNAWSTLEPTLASQLLADCLVTIGGQTNRPRAGETARLVEALQQTTLQKRTLAGCEITVHGNSLRIAREAARVAAPMILSGDGSTGWDGRFTIRHALPETLALTLRALGADGQKQLRTLAPHTAQRMLPSSTPSIWHLDEMLFVPHIGMPEEKQHSVTIGFTPAKPLAAAAFWCLNTH